MSQTCQTRRSVRPRTASIGRLICRLASSVDAYFAFARCEARALLLDHRRAVQRVADALLVHRTLDGCRIEMVIRGE